MQAPFPPVPAASVPATLVVHDAADLRRAIEAAQSAPLRHVRLLSAPAAACFLGPAWWRALIALAQPLSGALIVDDILDCGDAAGRALEALRLGQRALVLEPSAQWQVVSERATALGAILLKKRPAALDLAAHNALRRLDAWLAGADDNAPMSG